ncbi:MAG: sigma-54 dependent transcriptional regulator [Dysgonamonadaceae bacterium]|jgi:DNA-binding NtrC family response regulator|nr:sigma-54 dependent transcriptional regulator [Dysgonamonadaceae bacterium]
MKKGSILIIDDNKNVLTALRILLSNYFKQVTLLSSPNQIHTALHDVQPDVVLLDMNFSAGINSGNEGLFWLSEIKKQNADLPVVLFTAYADIDLAVKALKQGASDFVVKPWDNARLVATLQAACTLGESRKEVKSLKNKQSLLQDELNKDNEVCWGVSSAIRRLQSLIAKIAATDVNVLITGENGTGKEVVAREIHRLSLRSKEILVAVDMGAIPETLFESELFGHVKGSFTDAAADRSGKFEAADKGTLFLDEIGNLSFPLQAKLLNVLQSRCIVRVGENRPIPIDIRLICATNRDLAKSVKAGEFREDLFYRINTIQLEIPPLRERKEDVELLANFFLKKYAVKYHKENRSLSPEAVSRLKENRWEGNVRELQNVIQRAVILSDNAVLKPGDFLLNNNPVSPEENIQTMSLDHWKKILIENSLKRNNYKISAVAEELGISRPTLYSKLKKYDIHV